jgi:hypothetical protein
MRSLTRPTPQLIAATGAAVVVFVMSTLMTSGRSAAQPETLRPPGHGQSPSPVDHHGGAITIGLNPENVPTTAAMYANQCDADQGGGPFRKHDVWVFVLPGNYATSGDFVSLTGYFGANGSITTTTTTDPDNFQNGGSQTSVAWIVTPAGYTLTNATAVVTGTAGFFNLAHTCPARPLPTVSPTVSPTVHPTVSPTVSPTVHPTVSPTARPADSPTVAPKAVPPYGHHGDPWQSGTGQTVYHFTPFVTWLLSWL